MLCCNVDIINSLLTKLLLNYCIPQYSMSQYVTNEIYIYEEKKWIILSISSDIFLITSRISASIFNRYAYKWNLDAFKILSLNFVWVRYQEMINKHWLSWLCYLEKRIYCKNISFNWVIVNVCSIKSFQNGIGAEK